MPELDDPHRFLPLSPASFYALLALGDGDKHGYAILKEVRRQTGGRVRLSASTLYGLIQRLEDDGLVREATSRPDPALDDQRRRYYRLTKLGTRVAAAEAERLSEALELARERKLFPSPPLSPRKRPT